MTGKVSEVHMLLVGHSAGHVNIVADNGAKAVMLFTTGECMEIARSLSLELVADGINVIDICKLDPFSADSVTVMTEMISARCDEISRAGQIPVIGLTGGTNLMVAAMCLVAIRKKLKCHYICKGNNALLRIDLPATFASIGGSV